MGEEPAASDDFRCCLHRVSPGEMARRPECSIFADPRVQVRGHLDHQPRP